MSDTNTFQRFDDHLLYALPPVNPEATFFAPSARDSKEEIRRLSSIIDNMPMLQQTIDAMPDMVMILNNKRQIIAANSAFQKVLNLSAGQIVEKRPGEAVGCVRAKEGPGGCGTALHCAVCGAVNAILETQKSKNKITRECRILIDSESGNVPLDLKVTANPFIIDNDFLIVLVAKDISQEKRLGVFQRTFFHDILNSAGCIQGYAEYLASEPSLDEEVCKRLVHLSGQVIGEIQAQRDLLHAENGDFKTNPVPLKTRQIIEDIRIQYLRHPVAADRNIEIGEAWEGTIITDRQLLYRILGNMLKNALEATPAQGTIILECYNDGCAVVFSVNNPGVMPNEVQLQIFQRSFSTKEQAGRGIGTYSMKLFGERYLGGKVHFVSNEAKGTTFSLTIPKNLPAEH